MLRPTPKVAAANLVVALTYALFSPSPAAGELVISEFLADNDGMHADADGDFPDWIEVANLGSSPVNLAGFALTDNPADLAKWRFPARQLDPGEFLVVFASGKDRNPVSGELHTDFVLDSSGEFLALVAPDGATVVHGFAPRYPTQGENVSFGMGLAGDVTATDATPTWDAAGDGDGNYVSVRVNGAGAPVLNDSPNNFDNGTGAPQTQMYMWLDLSEKLASLPATGRHVVSAALKWNGVARAENSGVTVPSGLGLYPVTDGQMGISQVAPAFTGEDLVGFSAANGAVSSVTVAAAGGVDTPVEATWDLAPLVQAWIDAGDAGAPLEVMLVTDARPVWAQWDIGGDGKPTATFEVVTSTTASTDLIAQYFSSPTPGATNTGGALVGLYFGEVTRHPEQPVTGPLTITAQVSPAGGRPVTEVTAHYAKMFEAEATLTMSDDGTGADAVAGDGTYTAVIPAAAVEPGMMVRWRFEATDSAGLLTKEPPFRDSRESNEYWGTVGHDPDLETNLTVLHWFIPESLFRRAATDTGGRGAFYYLGELYDNVNASIHGQSTRGGDFPKKSYNLDFNRTQRFRWRADLPRAKDMDILTNWADKTKARHVLSWELMREAGVHAHEMFTLRVQRNGEFEMLSDMIENGDADYLERAGLDPEGALYKMFNRFQGPGDAGSTAEKKSREWEDKSDILAFARGVNSRSATERKTFLYDNLDIPKTVNMMAARMLSGMSDFGHKNYYLYRDSDGAQEWSILPWDLDLSFGHHWRSGPAYFDDQLYEDLGVYPGTDNGVVTMINGVREVQAMVYRRMRTLMDVYVQPVGTPDSESWLHRRLDEHLALLDPPSIEPSDADLDFMTWGSWSGAWEGGRTQTYRRRNYDDPHDQVRSMAEEIQRLKDEWIDQRRTYVYRQVGTRTNQIPEPLTATPPIAFGAVESAPASGNQDEEYIVLNNPTADWVDISGWKLRGGVEFTFEPGTVMPATTDLYVSPDVVVFRARETSPKGGEDLWVEGNYRGHLSSFGETIELVDAAGVLVSSHTYVGSPSDVQRSLAVSEIMYHPVNGQAEFLEVLNTSDSTTLDLAGVMFTEGIQFDFTGSDITSLAPGARAVIVRNLAFFESVYGTGLPVAGVFAGDTALGNGGDSLKLEDAEGGTVKSFSYDDVDPWPTSPDGGGRSLVLVDESTNPDPDLPGSWRASLMPGGTPGSEDREPTGFVGNPEADQDRDGVVALLEYFHGSSDLVAAGPADRGLSVGRSTVGGMADIQVQRSLTAAGVTHRIETSGNLAAWTGTDPSSLVSTTPNGDGTETLTYRVTAGEGIYVRLVVEVE